LLRLCFLVFCVFRFEGFRCFYVLKFSVFTVFKIFGVFSVFIVFSVYSVFLKVFGAFISLKSFLFLGVFSFYSMFLEFLVFLKIFGVFKKFGVFIPLKFFCVFFGVFSVYSMFFSVDRSDGDMHSFCLERFCCNHETWRLDCQILIHWIFVFVKKIEGRSPSGIRQTKLQLFPRKEGYQGESPIFSDEISNNYLLSIISIEREEKKTDFT
jgi:hypothetical protein